MASLESNLAVCGDVMVSVQSTSEAYTFNESTGEISIFTKAASKNGKTDTIVVQAYLKDYS